MLFKEFLIEGRPFYDEHGNKYVASKNDHYSKNGEEITKAEYDRVVHEIKSNKQIKPVKKENIEKNEKYLQELLPNAIIGFKTNKKNKEQIKHITECIDGLFIKYPKLKDFMSNRFIGDYKELLTRIDEINDKASKNKTSISKKDYDLLQKNFTESFEIAYKKHKKNKTNIKYFLYNFISLSQLDDFILDNHINSEDKISIFENKKIIEFLKNAYINSRLRLKMSKSFIQNPEKINAAGYYSHQYIPQYSGIVIKTEKVNGFSILKEPENYEHFFKTYRNKIHTIKEIMTHEMGHAIDDILDLNTNPEIIKLFDDNLDKIATEVSNYATTNIQEFIAECFTEYHLSENPRELSQKVGEIIDKLLK